MSRSARQSLERLHQNTGDTDATIGFWRLQYTPSSSLASTTAAPALALAQAQALALAPTDRSLEEEEEVVVVVEEEEEE